MRRHYGKPEGSPEASAEEIQDQAPEEQEAEEATEQEAEEAPEQEAPARRRRSRK